MNHRLATLIAASSLLVRVGFGQGLFIDTFDAGDFSESGNAGDTFSGVMNGSTIIGGSRGITIDPAGFYHAQVANGYLSVEVDDPGLHLELAWGDSSPLGLNLAAITAGGFVVNVYQGFTAYADLQFTAITAGGQESISPVIPITHDGQYFFAFSQFVAAPGGSAADFTQINQIVMTADLSPVGSGAFLSLDSIAASAVPEPEEWAAMGGMMLLGFAVWRRRAQLGSRRRGNPRSVFPRSSNPNDP